MGSLALSWYAMHHGFSPRSAGKIWSREASFLVDRQKRQLVYLSENTVVLVPLDAPSQLCTDDFYSEHVRGSLVLLWCVPADGCDLALVALGVFVGNRVWSNGTDPDTRFRALPENIAPPYVAHDGNRLLAAVHVITSFLGPRPVLLGGLAEAAACTPGICSVQDPRLPSPLSLLIPDVHSALRAPGASVEDGSRHVLASSLRAALDLAAAARVEVSASADADRRAALVAVVEMLDGDGGADVNMPQTRRKVVSDLHPKRTEHTAGILRRAAANLWVTHGEGPKPGLTAVHAAVKAAAAR